MSSDMRSHGCAVLMQYDTDMFPSQGGAGRGGVHTQNHSKQQAAQAQSLYRIYPSIDTPATFGTLRKSVQIKPVPGQSVMWAQRVNFCTENT